MKRGAEVGVRGPFGSAWPVAQASGLDVIVIAGGIGLAPLRPAIYELLRTREQFGRVGILYGARAPAELLFRRELDAWRRRPELQVRVSVDRGESTMDRRCRGRNASCCRKSHSTRSIRSR